jgi:hypothetical protein
LAGLSTHVNAGETAENAYHALESEAAAHDCNEDELPKSTVNGLEDFTVLILNYGTINANLAPSDKVVQERVVAEPVTETTACSNHSNLLYK